MDSPERNKIVTSTSSSPAAEESPLFTFLNKLSPIKPVRAAHVARGLAELNFLPPPPPVFTSPRINPQPETNFVNRPHYPHSSNAELSLECGNRSKTLTACSHVSGPTATRSMLGLFSCTQNGHENKGSVQVEPCSPGCVEEFLTDPVESDTLNSADLDDLCLKHSNDAPQVSQGVCMRSTGTIMKLDNYGDDTREDMETEIATQLNSLEPSEEVLEKSLFHVKSGQHKDGEGASDDCPYGMSEKVTDLVLSNLSLESASCAQTCQNFVVQGSIDSPSIISKTKEHGFADFDEKRTDCSESLCHHKSLDVKLQNTDGGQQGESECNPQLLHEPLQIVPAYENFNENSEAISNGSIENKMLYDCEDSSQHQRGMRRRCLQFEAAERRNIIDNGYSFQNPKHIPNSELPSNPSESKILDSSHRNSSLTSSHNICQSITSGSSLHPVRTPEVRNIGNSSITAPMPSGIGLHLNSVVNATSMGCSVSPGLKLAQNDNLTAQRERSTSVIKPHVSEESKSNSLPTSLAGKFSDNNDDDQLESQAIVTESSATYHSSHENAEGLGEFDQLSPKKKRKRTSYTVQNEGCKRCNCRRSKCLKLYCECFAAGIYCAEPCACQGCFNKPEYEDTVLGTRQQIESRNPLAFAPRIVRRATESPVNSGEDGSRMTPSSARHKRGCNCKKSMCLKKYCECYQAGVGCSVGCRCEGCKNIFGIKEGYHEITEMVYKKADDECWEDESEGKLDARRNFLHPEQRHAHNISPLTPLIEYSSHIKDVPKSGLPARRYLPSPESDDNNTLSSYGKSPRPLRSSNHYDMQAKMGEENMEIISYDLKLECSVAGTVDQFSPRWDGLSDICDLTPLPHPPSRATASSSSSNTSDCRKVSGVQLCRGSVRLSSCGSICLRSSPKTPMPQLGVSKMPQGPDSESGYEILEDDTPEILKDTPTPIRAVKVSSPNQKRVSPPHSRLHELRSNSSPGLRSGRKFVLQSISSFPPLTPFRDPKGGNNDK